MNNPMIRPLALAGCLCLLAVATLGSAQAADAGNKDALTIVSWGGVYQQSQRKAYFQPFSKASGIPIKEASYDGDFSKVVKQVESGNPTWQVADVTLQDAIRGCRNGQLEPIPPTILSPAPNGSPPMQDFLQNTLHECAVGQYVWSTVWGYDKTAYDEAPKTIQDVFNIDKFPGKRGMRKTPVHNLEWALLADGVAPKDVYSVLSTKEGQDRAFRKLDSIRDHILWWMDGDTPQKWLASGKVGMATGYNGRIFNSIVKKNEPLGFIWDGQIWQIETWVIPRGAPRVADALQFIKFATSTKSMARLTQYLSYAPARKSSFPLIQRDYRSYMPTAPSNMRHALQNDFIWWSKNQQAMQERFDAWLKQG